MNAETFDFGFGAGPVPAHRHVNPDGSLGGWVADTARVTPNAHLFIGPRARIVGGTIWGGTIHSGTIRAGIIHGGTIRSNDDIVIAGPVGSRGDVLCLVNDPSIAGGVRVTTGCFNGSWDEFRAAVERTHPKGSRHRQAYEWVGAALYATIRAGQSSRGG